MVSSPRCAVPFCSFFVALPRFFRPSLDFARPSTPASSIVTRNAHLECDAQSSRPRQCGPCQSAAGEESRHTRTDCDNSVRAHHDASPPRLSLLLWPGRRCANRAIAAHRGASKLKEHVHRRTRSRKQKRLPSCLAFQSAPPLLQPISARRQHTYAADKCFLFAVTTGSRLKSTNGTFSGRFQAEPDVIFARHFLRTAFQEPVLRARGTTESI